MHFSYLLLDCRRDVELSLLENNVVGLEKSDKATLEKEEKSLMESQGKFLFLHPRINPRFENDGGEEKPFTDILPPRRSTLPKQRLASS